MAVNARRAVNWTLLFAFWISTLVLFSQLTDLIEDHGRITWDARILSALVSHRSPILSGLAAFLNLLGGGAGLLLVASVSIAMLTANRRIREAFFVVGAVGGARILDAILKDVIDRARPYVARAGILPRGPALALLVLIGLVVVLVLTRTGRSALIAGIATFIGGMGLDFLLDALLPVKSGADAFPSGHAVGSTALAVSLMIIAWPTRFRRIGIFAGITFVTAVGASRIYSGVHRPSEIVGSWSLAVVWVLGLWAILRTVHMLRPDVGVED